MPRRFWPILGFAGMNFFLIVICYDYADRPVALLAARDLDPHILLLRLFQAMAAPSLVSLPFGLIYLSALALKAGWSRRVWPYQTLLTQISVAILAATSAKDMLKWAFGRPWPYIFVHYGSYQFNFFSNGIQYGCFPSGHTAYISAPLLVLAHERPQWRWPCYGVIGVVMLGLVGGGYHFPGDTLAGLLTGFLAAQGTLVLLRRAQ